MRTKEQLAEIVRKMLAIMKCKHNVIFANPVLQKYYVSFVVKSIGKKIA